MDGADEFITIGNGAGITAKLSRFGARLVDMWVPDRDGVMADIVLGHDRISDCLTHGTSYFGATCGRYANRIAAGRFDLAGQTIQLDRNEGANHLHGGNRGFDRQTWDLVETSNRLARFRLISPDGDMGYPGSLTVEACYSFAPTGQLDITMTATVTDRPTIVNLVNHAYFNLAGQGSGTIMAQHLAINADHYLPVNAALLPLGAPQRVAGTAFDFRQPRPIGSALPGAGFDHNFCLNPSDSPAVIAHDPASGRGLRLFTNQPGVQLYTGAKLRAGLPGKRGAVLAPSAGFTLETQRWPDSPNHPDFPSARLDPGETYRHAMSFAFFTD